MQVKSSARKHGISDEDMRHAIRNVMFYREREYGGEMQVLFIGPAVDGRLLEIVATPSPDPVKIIHADNLRANLFHLIS